MDIKPIKQGIGGWLTFFLFCLFVTGIRFAISIIQDIALLLQINSSSVDIPLKINLSVIGVFILELILLTFLVLAFYKLIKIKKDAVFWVKKMLVSIPVFYFICSFFLKSDLMFFNALSQEYFQSSIKASIFSLIWYLYFNLSIRIKNTYIE